MTAAFKTPQRQLLLSTELRNVINEHHIFTTRTRMKALDNITKDSTEERENSLRCQAIQEILTSEVSYLQQLEVIMKFFVEPLKQATFITQATYLTLFGHIESLYNVNGELLNELKENPENIAATFLKLAPFFKLYSVYAYDYKEAMAVLQDLQKSNPALSKFIANQESRPEVGTKLMSLLIAPIQRIPRYRLLLKEVIAHTSSGHPDYTVLKASLHEVEKTADHINSLVKEHENVQRMIKLQRYLCGGKPRIVTPGRRLIKEGLLMKVSAHGRKSHLRYFVLFNDMLMYCKVKLSPPSEPTSLKCCCILPLKKCTVNEILSKGMFKVTCQSEELILFSKSVEEGESWISALKNAVKQYHECRQTLRKESSSRKPVRRHFECDLSQEDLLMPVKKMRTYTKQNPTLQEPLKDSLYPLRSSMKNKRDTPSRPEWNVRFVSQERNTTVSDSVNAINEEKENITQPVTSSWRQQGTQIFRSLAARFRRAIHQHIVWRSPSVPFFR